MFFPHCDPYRLHWMWYNSTNINTFFLGAEIESVAFTFVYAWVNDLKESILRRVSFFIHKIDPQTKRERLRDKELLFDWTERRCNVVECTWYSNHQIYVVQQCSKKVEATSFMHMPSHISLHVSRYICNFWWKHALICGEMAILITTSKPQEKAEVTSAVLFGLWSRSESESESSK